MYCTINWVHCCKTKIGLSDTMERITVEQEVKELEDELEKLDKERVKIQTRINAIKMKLSRDKELLEIMDDLV